MSARVLNQARERSAARRLLVVSDCVTAAAVAMLAMNALRPGASLVGIAFIVAAAIVPRLAAEMIESPRALFGRGVRLTPARLLLAGGLLLAVPVGYRVLSTTPGFATGVGFEMILLALCWVAGFGLRDPAAYVLYEPLALGTALLSLLRGASHAVPLVTATFLAICVSGALRRQLASSTDVERKGRVNVRSARLLGALAALLLLLVFTLSNAGLDPILERSTPAASLDRGADDPSRRPKRGAREESERRDESQGGAGGTADELARGAGTSGRTSAVAPPSLRGGGTILPDGATAEVVLRVRTQDAGPEGAEPGSLPDSDTLWRARSYVRYDAKEEAWADDGLHQWSVPQAEGRTIRRTAARGGAPTTWEATMVAESFDCLLLPYSTHEIQVETIGAAADVRANARGDLSWTKLGLRVSPTYWIVLQPLAAAAAEIAPGIRTGPASSPAELETPTRSALGLSLRTLAREEMGPEGGALPAKIARLRTYFQRSFRYARASDRTLPEGLSEFLQKNRVGTCQHFATAAALLLRASGVPTRLVTGFSGARWDASAEGYVVRAGHAHAWIEVSTAGGWMPVDPTDWVERTASGSGSAQDDGTESPPDGRRPAPRITPPDWLVVVIVAAAAALSLFAFRRRRKQARQDPPEEEEPAPSPEPVATPQFVPRTPAEHLLFEYGRLQEDLAETGQERRSHETPREHARRVSVPEPARIGDAFSSLVPMIDDGLYGHVDLTDADLARGRRDILDLKKFLG